ncbi:hypothetical protein [Roseateles sp. YR242]|uniref:hypothetical protein n=1 Tax=Roseateles sp. YR242 TaxID=1855305 RepID=UPI001160AA96|nr:hypothetical protein [Roseateles sp. YR242]
MSELPRTLAGMEDAFRRLITREIDCTAIARIVGEARQYGGRAFEGAGKTPVASNAALMQLAERHLDDYYRALGLETADRRALRSANGYSGLWYPSASLPVNLLQYVLPSVLGATGNPGWGLGIAGVSAAMGFVLTGVLQQPLAVLPSEHTAERHGPLIHVDKTQVNYQHYLPLAAAQAAAHARSQRQHVENTATVLNPARRDDLHAFLSSASQEQRNELREAATQLLRAAQGIDHQHRRLLATEGAHQRQVEGVWWQRPWRVARPVIASGLGLLSGVDARKLDPEAFAQKLRHVGRRQRLPPAAVAVLQIVWILLCQTGQHAAAGADERNKVRYKTLLDLAFADVLTPAGRDCFERGLPLQAHHVDADKCRARVLGPVQSLAKRVDRVLKEALAHLPDGHALRGELQQQREAVRAGRFTELDPENDWAGRMMLQASRQGIWASMFNRDSVLHHDIRAKSTLSEWKVQWTQRGTQSFHFGVAGTAAASMSTRIVTAAHGTASSTPTAWLIGALVLNTLLSWISAWSAAETQTLKNFGKEGVVPIADPERGDISRRPSTGSQIRHGLISGADLLIGQNRAAQAHQHLQEAIRATAGDNAPVAFARSVLDALDALDAPVAPDAAAVGTG